MPVHRQSALGSCSGLWEISNGNNRHGSNFTIEVGLRKGDHFLGFYLKKLLCSAETLFIKDI
jgi:hypothetical protein